MLQDLLTLQCNTCRRTTQVQRDDFSSLITNCTLTRGCRGRLTVISGANKLTNDNVLITNPAARQQLFQSKATISTSNSGTLTLGVRASSTTIGQFDSIKIESQRQVISNLAATEYIKVLQIPKFVQIQGTEISGTEISGKDGAGRNIRFDQNAIDQSRVQVSLNGVIRAANQDYVVMPNVITFLGQLSVGDRVSITVFPETAVELFDIEFVYTGSTQNNNSSAWSNVKWIDEYLPNGEILSSSGERIWCFETLSNSVPSDSLLRINKIYFFKNNGATLDIPLENAFFLLANSPYSNFDRVREARLPVAELVSGYTLTRAGGLNGLFSVDSSKILSINPPMILVDNGEISQNSSLLSPNTVSATVAEEDIKIKSKFVNGPV